MPPNPQDAIRQTVRARLLARSGEARRLREEAGLSIREFAAFLGVDPSSVSRWETGEAVPSRRGVAIRLAEALDEMATVLGKAERQENRGRELSPPAAGTKTAVTRAPSPGPIVAGCRAQEHGARDAASTERG